MDFKRVAAIFFQAIGKPVLSGAISLSRQIVFLIPTVMILCNYMTIKGVLLDGTVADGLAFVFEFTLSFAKFHLCSLMEKIG